MAEATVQHVPKASSDQLLRKFAELESDSAARSPKKLQLVKVPMIVRRKRSRRVASGLGAREVAIGDEEKETARRMRKRRSSGGAAEWGSSLLSLPSRRSKSLIRKLGIGTEEAAGIGVLIAALEKAWRKTMEGASKVFIEKHCSTHVRLISDVV